MVRLAHVADGAAFDPATQQWRVLPPSGLSARAPLSVWTGDELIVWGTSFRTKVRPLDGAAYDPASDAWRPIAFPLRGRDAMALGIPPGPRMGALLREVEQWWEDGGYRADHAACLERLRALIAEYA